MFLGNPAKYLASNPFRFKMASLAWPCCASSVCSGGFSDRTGVRRRSMNILVAGLSLTLWFTVGWAGRAIAFI